MANEMQSEEAIFASSRQRKRHYIKFFFFIILLLLNGGSIVSLLGRLISHGHVELVAELFHFLMVAIIDIYMVPPIIFEVDSVTVYKGSIELKALLWKRRLKFEEIRGYQVHPHMIWAIVSTPRCFYLINKRDIDRFADFDAVFRARLPS